MIFYSAYIYGTNFIAKFLWKSGFLWEVYMKPLGHQQEWKYLGHLSVNEKPGVNWYWTEYAQRKTADNDTTDELGCTLVGISRYPSLSHFVFEQYWADTVLLLRKIQIE